MGQALYRKYRSRSLDELVGQEHIIVSLRHALERKQLAHAYLFTGPRGVGKTSVARILAHAVNEVPYDDDETQHLDIIEIDAASNNSVEDVRELREKVHIAPTTGKYKVYIIDEVHMLSKAAFNALLKTLEEPPPHVIFIMATTEPHKLPETIISRTQRFTFRPVEATKVQTHLRAIADAEKISINDEALSIIAAHGDGSLRDSIGLLDQVSHSDVPINADKVLELLGNVPAARIRELIVNLQAAQPSSLLVGLEEMLLEGYDPVRIAQQLAKDIREQVFIKQQLSWPTEPTLTLLDQLMQVPATVNPEVSLELALLVFMNQLTPVVVPVAKANKSTKASATEILAKVEEKKNTLMPKVSVAASKEVIPPTTAKSKTSVKHAELNDSFWPLLLDAVKKHHNTLYSILRMAKPEWQVDEGRPKLILYCRFAFHQKQLTEAKNHQILLKIIEELSGEKVTIHCQLQKSETTKQKPTKVEEPSDNNDPLATVSNIFGGAELLES